MYRDYANLTRSLQFACVWTIVLQALALAFGGYLFSDWRLCVLCLPLGWLPLLLISIRRPNSPTRLDIATVFAAFPIIFGAAVVLDRLYFHPG